MKRLVLPAILLTTAVAAQDVPPSRQFGGEWDPDNCHVTPMDPPAHDSPVQQQLGMDVTGVSNASQCPGGFDPNDPCKDQSHCVVDRAGPSCLNRISASISGASAGVRLPSGGAAA